MHYFIYPTKDSWISSGSNRVTGVSEKDQNFGQDPILEIKKVFYNQSFDYPTRALVQFDLTDISKSVADGKITNPKYFLRLYEAEGNKELSTEYKLASFPISHSWDEGSGKFGDNPKVTNGVSWINRNNKPNTNEVAWNNTGVTYYSSSGNWATQSFSYESPDINMDVTRIVKNWITGSTSNSYIPNNGFLLRFSGSQELGSGSGGVESEEIYGNLKFFSSQTHTIYPPKLEVRWDDSSESTGSKDYSELDVTGASDNYLYMIGLRDKYRETEKVKFRVGSRKQYVQKTFLTSVQTVSASHIPLSATASYSIMDVATGETIIPFSDYTKLSHDATSTYFIQWMNGFQPNRVYKIIYKLNYTDNQEQIFDNNFEFKITR
jgi:hypothetical protein